MGEVCGSGWGEFARGCSLQALVMKPPTMLDVSERSSGLCLLCLLQNERPFEEAIELEIECIEDCRRTFDGDAVVLVALVSTYLRWMDSEPLGKLPLG